MEPLRERAGLRVLKGASLREIQCHDTDRLNRALKEERIRNFLLNLENKGDFYFITFHQVRQVLDHIIYSTLSSGTRSIESGFWLDSDGLLSNTYISFKYLIDIWHLFL